jgi:hypothetical protein
MVAHSSDMQDPSLHAIPRHLQHTESSLSPRQYSPSPQCFTPDSSLSHSRNADGLVTAYMHHVTSTSSIPLHITLDSTLSRPLDAEGLVTTYMHHHHDTETAPSQCWALEHDTDPLSLILGHQPPRFGYIGRLLYLQSSTVMTLI